MLGSFRELRRESFDEKSKAPVSFKLNWCKLIMCCYNQIIFCLSMIGFVHKPKYIHLIFKAITKAKAGFDTYVCMYINIIDDADLVIKEWIEHLY